MAQERSYYALQNYQFSHVHGHATPPPLIAFIDMYTIEERAHAAMVVYQGDKRASRAS
jgi:hypothetical protein